MIDPMQNSHYEIHPIGAIHRDGLHLPQQLVLLPLEASTTDSQQTWTIMNWMTQREFPTHDDARLRLGGAVLLPNPVPITLRLMRHRDPWQQGQDIGSHATLALKRETLFRTLGNPLTTQLPPVFHHS